MISNSVNEDIDFGVAHVITENRSPPVFLKISRIGMFKHILLEAQV